jgi:hypothetical protein
MDEQLVFILQVVFIVIGLVVLLISAGRRLVRKNDGQDDKDKR